MNRNKKKKNNQESEKTFRSQVEEIEIRRIKEPRPICVHCGEPIEAICEAISEGEGNFSHFSCVINDIKERYHVEEPDKVSYIGGGCFAIISTDPQTKKFSIREKIAYETPESFSNMKKFVEDSKENE